MSSKIAVAAGDGIGPEIMESVLRIFKSVQVPLEFVPVEMGKSVFERGFSNGMTSEAQETIEELGILFKGPMETPKGAGVKSINVTARKVWNTYANKRVFRSINGVDTPFSKAGIPVNITIVRENIEDTYGGIEHFLTHDVALCRRFITRPGCEQIHRYTFEMAKKNGLDRVVCGHKANIMKLTDGLFLETFYQIAKDYPEIQASDVIVDDLAMKLVKRPDLFQVIVLPNLQGDIISDLCAGLVGGLGFAPSANIGDAISIFEAVHGTAPDIAGKGVANPTSLLLSGTMMLRHLGLISSAVRIEDALMNVLSHGLHTGDFGDPSTPALTTVQYTDAIVAELKKTEGKTSGTSSPETVTLQRAPKPPHNKILQSPKKTGDVCGVDLFVESDALPSQLADSISPLLPGDMSLVVISNRGTQVWPKGSVYTDCVNQYRVRIERTSKAPLSVPALLTLAAKITEHVTICSVEVLRSFDGKAGYSLAQGQ